VYDAATFLPVYQSLTNGRVMPFANPPLLAWLVVPLTVLPAAAALAIWVALLAGALLVTWWLLAPGRWPERVFYLILAVGLYPFVEALKLGQVTPLIVVAIAASFRLWQSGSPGWAGLALAPLALKPQVALLLPFALLAAREWRLVASWAMATAVLATVCVAVLGLDGLREYSQALQLVRTLPELPSLTLFAQLDGGVAGALAALVAAVIALATAWRGARIASELPWIAGVLGSVLAVPYINRYDASVLVVAGWLVLRSQLPLAFKLGLLAAYLPLEVANTHPSWLVAFECAYLACLAAFTFGVPLQARRLELAGRSAAVVEPSASR
jgi:hypothetical protein